MGQAMADFVNSFPDSVKKIFRMGDYFSGAGFLGTEIFSLIFPMVMIGIGLAWGASATAEDEERGSADLLFALPISRAKILWSRLVAMFSALILLALISFINLFIRAKAVDMEISTSKLAAATLSCLLLGALFATLGAALGAATGRKGGSLGIGAGVATLLYVFYTVSTLVSKFDFVKVVNPFEWYMNAEQLRNGLDILVNIKLLITSSAFIAIATWVIQQRDIHSS